MGVNRDMKAGDKVLVNSDAFDEQIERMEDSTKTYIISETKEAGSGTSGQWAKIEGGINLKDIDTGEIRNDNGWIDVFWLKKV
jgi:hypothetical protein